MRSTLDVKIRRSSVKAPRREGSGTTARRHSGEQCQDRMQNVSSSSVAVSENGSRHCNSKQGPLSAEVRGRARVQCSARPNVRVGRRVRIGLCSLGARQCAGRLTGTIRCLGVSRIKATPLGFQGFPGASGGLRAGCSVHQRRDVYTPNQM